MTPQTIDEVLAELDQIILRARQDQLDANRSTRPRTGGSRPRRGHVRCAGRSSKGMANQPRIACHSPAREQ